MSLRRRIKVYKANNINNDSTSDSDKKTENL